MKIENRQQFLVLLTVAVFALWIALSFIIEPLAGVWSSRQTQIKNLRAKVSDGQKLVNREAGVRGRWADMQAHALPANPSQAEQMFIKALDGWARDTGAGLTSITPQWKNNSTNYMTLSCRVEASGDIGTLSRLLYELEKGPMAVRLDSVELGTRDNTGRQMTLGLEINGLALLAQEKKQKP